MTWHANQCDTIQTHYKQKRSRTNVDEQLNKQKK